MRVNKIEAMYKRKQQPIAVKASKRQSGKKKDLWWKETFTTHFESMQITSDFVCVDIRTFGSYFTIYNVGILFNFTLLKTFSPSEAFVRGSMCLVFHFFLWLPLLFLPGVLQVLFCSPIRSLVVTVSHLISLRSKCFQAVSEQRNRAKNGASRRAGRGVRAAKTENTVRSSVFLCYEATRKSLLRRLHLTNGVIAVLCSNYHFSS